VSVARTLSHSNRTLVALALAHESHTNRTRVPHHPRPSDRESRGRQLTMLSLLKSSLLQSPPAALRQGIAREAVDHVDFLLHSRIITEFLKYHHFNDGKVSVARTLSHSNSRILVFSYSIKI
jgi:hypothetical protein